MVLEEREQVLLKSPAVVRLRLWPEMTFVSQPPVLGVFVERRQRLRGGSRRGARWLPYPALDVGQNVPKHSLGLGQSDRTERDVLASAFGGKPEPSVGPVVLALAFDDLACCRAWHQAGAESPVAFRNSSMMRALCTAVWRCCLAPATSACSLM